jgi:hypothetical protein
VKIVTIVPARVHDSTARPPHERARDVGMWRGAQRTIRTERHESPPSSERCKPNAKARANRGMTLTMARKRQTQTIGPPPTPSRRQTRDGADKVTHTQRHTTRHAQPQARARTPHMTHAQTFVCESRLASRHKPAPARSSHPPKPRHGTFSSGLGECGDLQLV